MSRAGRILVVDDDDKWQDQLVAILTSRGFVADARSTAKEALTYFKETYCHILLLDIRLVQNDPNNIDGIDLLAELDKRGLSEAIKVIAISGHGNEERIRILFKDYEVADYLFKDTFNTLAFLSSLNEVFSQKAHINLELKEHWQLRSNAEQTVVNLEVNGIRIKHGDPLQNQIAVELDDLLCRLFYQAESIMIRPLSVGRSGAGVIRVRPFYHDKGGGREVVVKFGDFRQIEKEYDNFKKYIQPFLGGGRNTNVLDVRRTPRLGGIIYSLLGTSIKQVVDFGTFYRRATIPKVKGALDRLFKETCGDWYANRGHLQLLDLAIDYQQWFGNLSVKLESAFSKQLTSVQGKQKLLFKSLKSNRTFTNPLLVTSGLSLAYPTYTCITHGDFNQFNLLVDNNSNTWLIDFQQTGPSHILRDLATLDSVIRFQLLMSDEATLEERLQMEEALCSIEHFSQVKLLAAKFSKPNKPLMKAYATVLHLRSIAQRLVEQNPADDISEYYIALFYNAMNTIRFSSLQQVQREHALLSASLLADRLGLNTPASSSSDPKGNESNRA
jgi:DNA-binding response OmpR family regulator/thiamine kinase-like enzyme